MSSAKLAKEKASEKVDVHISKETGGAYANTREVIKSELLRIQNDIAHRATSNGKICNTDTRPSGTGR